MRAIQSTRAFARSLESVCACEGVRESESEGKTVRGRKREREKERVSEKDVER